MAAAEAAPLAQAGGVGDVLRALPAALARAGARVERLLPAYGSVERAGFEYEDGNLAVPLGPSRAPVRFLGRTGPDGVRTTLVECEEMFSREGIYGPPGGAYPDNARRFTLFSRAVCERARRAARPPDILHAHDWHAALVPLFVRFAGPWRSRPPRTVLTIHNLAYQGRFEAEEADWLALPGAARGQVWRADGLEDHGGVNLLKGGLAFADALTTVSPTHAREILTPEFGSGLEGLLRRRRADLRGILNGADYDVWNPAADPNLPRPFDAGALEGKRQAQQDVRAALGLPAADRPLIAAIGRLVHQKGIDVLAQAAPALLESGADLAILGAGESELEHRLRDLRDRRPDRVGLRLGYDVPLSHRIVAGADLLLVPSRYEPCGLVQMHALRYATIPIVHRTGGLADTVRGEDETPGSGTGFLFSPLTPEALAGAVRRALALRRSDPAAWHALRQRAMAERFSWEQSAAEYARLYSAISG